MIRLGVLGFFLIACGGPSRDAHGRPICRMFAVTPAYADLYEELVQETNATAGYEMLGYGFGRDAGIVVIDDERVKASDPLAVAGANWPDIFFREESYVAKFDAYRKLILAHEIAHLLTADNLGHSDDPTDLLYKHIAVNCVGHEAECLVEVMRKRGLL